VILVFGSVGSTHAASVTIGLNFMGSHLGLAGAIPPDTMGAVGPDHIVELLNGRYAVYDKNSGSLLQGSNLQAFWVNAGVAPEDNSPFDPRLLYDPDTQRWFAVSVDGDQLVTNNFLVAVSNTSDPTQGWTGFQIASDPTDQTWADFPMLGIDGEAVYLWANMWIGSAYATGGRLVVLPKADLLAPAPTTAGATFFDLEDSWAPVIDLDGTGLPATLLWMSPGFHLRSLDIVGNAASPTLAAPWEFDSNLYQGPDYADQPGPLPNLATSG
jgi:hypothetical protein